MSSPRRPSPLSEVLSRVLRERLTGAAREEVLALRVFTAFERIGPPLTEHAEPVLFRGGVLTLNVRSSAWLTELTFLKHEILERLAQHLGKRAVRDVRLRLGGVEPRVTRSEPRPALDAAALARVEAWSAEVADPAVREALARAAIRCLERGSDGLVAPEGAAGPLPVRTTIATDPEPEVILTYGYGRREIDRWTRPAPPAEPVEK